MDTEVFTIKLPEKIQYARRRAGLSQEQLAEHLGISRQAVSKWETGEAMPDATKLAPLASALGVSIDWLLNEDEPQFASEPEEDWADKLPRHISRLAKRWGWLAGVYIAVMGGVFAAMGLLARFAVSRMVGGMSSIGGFGSSGDPVIDNFASNNPVTIFGGFMLVFGLVVCVAGIVLAVVLKQKSKK